MRFVRFAKRSCQCADCLLDNHDHPTPTIGICASTGASYDTLITLLCHPDGIEWNVRVYLRDGVVLEGYCSPNPDDRYGDSIVLSPNGSAGQYDVTVPTVVMFDNVVHLQIT